MPSNPAATLRARPRHAFVLRERNLRLICDVFSGWCVSIEAESPDGEREFESLEAFLAYERAEAKKVIRMKVRGRTEGHDWATVELDARWWSTSPCRILVNGPETVAETIRELLLVAVRETRPWYSFLSHRVGFINTAIMVPHVLMVLDYYTSGREDLSNWGYVTSALLIVNFLRIWAAPRGRFVLWRKAHRQAGTRKRLANTRQQVFSPLGIIGLLSLAAALLAIFL